MVYVSLAVALVASIILTPIVRRLAFRIGAVDAPNYRKVHQKIMPRLGGLAIFLSFLIGLAILRPESPRYESSLMPLSIVLGALVIVITGILDDKYQISAKAKMLGQIVAASIVIFMGGVQIDFINLPFDNGILNFGLLSIPLTLLWIVGITNAVNLIDGLDGLATGVSTIALITLATMAYIMGNGFVLAVLCDISM